MPLGLNIKHLMTLSPGTTYSKLAEACGTDSQAIQSLVSRQSQRSVYAPTLAKYFRVPLELLLEGTPDQLSHHLLNVNGISQVSDALPLPYSTSVAEASPITSHVAQDSRPLYLSAVPVAGVVTTGLGEIHKMSEIAEGEKIRWPSLDEQAYALRIHGDHLAPRARHGEYMIIEPNVTAGPGDEVVVYRNDQSELLIGQLLYFRDGMAYLEDINGRGQRLSLEEKSINCIHQIGGFAKSTLRVQS